MRKRTLLWALLLCTFSARAQSDATTNHRWLNQLIINPAAVENSDYMNINLMTRNQWQGFDGAPATQFLTAATYWDKYKSGLSLVVQNDKIGHTRAQGYRLGYSYQLQVNKSIRWSFGISSGVSYKSIDWDKITMQNTGDPEYARLDRNRVMPNLGIGTEFRHQYFTLGGALLHWESLWDRDEVLDNTMNNYLYLILNIPLTDQLSVAPAGYYTNRKNVNLFEANAILNWKKRASSENSRNLFWFGGGYRFSVEGLVAMLGVHVNKNFSLGYSYEANLGAIGKQSNGSHELILRYQFKMFNK